jgi:hypothetical protein
MFKMCEYYIKIILTLMSTVVKIDYLCYTCTVYYDLCATAFDPCTNGDELCLARIRQLNINYISASYCY